MWNPFKLWDDWQKAQDERHSARLEAEADMIIAWQLAAEQMKNVAQLLSELRLEKEVIEVVRKQTVEVFEHNAPQNENEAVERIALAVFAKDGSFARRKPERLNEFCKSVFNNVSANFPAMAFSFEQVANQVKAMIDEGR
jgi:hypothetical protein